jgi:hypothetical protein
MLAPVRVPVLGQDEKLVDVLPDLSEGNVYRALVLEGDRLDGFLSIQRFIAPCRPGGRRRRPSRVVTADRTRPRSQAALTVRELGCSTCEPATSAK